MGIEYYCETLIVAQVEALFFLELLGLRECLTDSGAELLCLFVLIAHYGSSSHLSLLPATQGSKALLGCSCKADFLLLFASFLA